MRPLAMLALRSAWNRRFVLSLTLVSIALASFLLLGIERLRADVRASFSQAVSGTDLIVGARTSPVQLMLYAVFRIGSASNEVRWDSLQALAKHPAVAWLVPIALGDSHRGFAVLGTSAAYFEHFRHGEKQALSFAQGKPFDDSLDTVFDTVLGSDVADRLGYKLGDRIVLAHGAGDIDGGLAPPEHADKPFTVTGILAPTGTPVDRSVHVGLAAIEAIHLDWQGGAPMPGVVIAPELVRKFDLRPKRVTAALVGLKNRAAVFAVQRFIAGDADEPLMAVLPGVALDELWQVVGFGEQALLAVSGLVALVGLAGLVAVVLAGLDARRRELAVLRAVGAGPRHVFALLALEGAALTLAGVLLGVLALLLAIVLAGPWVQAAFGITLRLASPTASQGAILCALLAVGWLASLVPGWRAYRLSAADGLVAKV